MVNIESMKQFETRHTHTYNNNIRAYIGLYHYYCHRYITPEIYKPIII